MPLEVLFVNDTKVEDLSIMKGMPLTTIRIDFKPERDTALLKSLGALISINSQEPKEFFTKNGKPGFN